MHSEDISKAIESLLEKKHSLVVEADALDDQIDILATLLSRLEDQDPKHFLKPSL